MAKRAYGLERVPFNQVAKQLRADDNLPRLVELAAGQVFPPVGKGHPAAELRQALVTGAAKAANEWWADGGNCWRMVDKAIKAAARAYRGTGGDAIDLTWRGAYDKDTRQYSSRDGKSAVIGLDADEPDAAVTEAPAPEATENLSTTDARAATVNAIAAARNASNATEIISHGAQDDGERLACTDFAAQGRRHDAGNDGEAGYGVDGASAGLFSGRVRVTDWDTAQCEAGERLAERNPAAWKLLTAIHNCGTYSPKNETFTWHLKTYIGKSVDRKRRAGEIERAAIAAARERNRIVREVMAEIEAGTFPPPVEPPGEPAPSPPRATVDPYTTPEWRRAMLAYERELIQQERAALAAWERDWVASNASWVKVSDLPAYGQVPWQDMARLHRERRHWLAEARQRYGERGGILRAVVVSVLDGADG